MYIGCETEACFFSISDAVQILLSIVGFVIAFIEINKIRTSAKAAKEATEKTQESIKEIFSIIDATDIVNVIRELKNYLRTNKIESAQIKLDEATIKLAKLCTRDDLINSDSYPDFQKISLYFSKLHGLFEKCVNDEKELPTPTINKRLSEFIAVISGWAEKRKFNPRS